MSGDGPESVPTSSDPRSKRPTKKRALTPNSAQAASVASLFAHPEQALRVAAAASAAPRRATGPAPPPEIVSNVQGSSAGAGSGEFHVYKASRRRENDRLRAMDAELRREREAEDFESARRAREARDGERTRKNKEKRDKAKARKARIKAEGGPVGGESEGGKGSGRGGGGGGESEGDGGDEPAELKGRQQENGNGAAGTSKAMSAGGEASGLVIHDDD